VEISVYFDAELLFFGEERKNWFVEVL